MTTEHPITPPPELVQRWEQAWYSESWDGDLADLIGEIWGESSDRELEACVGWLISNQNPRWAAALQEARRPKPPSLKAQAFAALKNSPVDPVDGTLQLSADAELIIRKALALLNDDD